MSLPNGYKRLEYIEYRGTQHINTGFKPNQTTRVVVEMQLTDSALEQTPFLARKASQEKSFGIFLQSAGWAVDYGTLRLNFSSKITATERLSLDFDKTKVTMNGETLTFSAQEFLTPVNLFLFVRNTNGTLNNYAIAKLYFCRIYDNGTLIRDYIPCQTTSGEIGLWDDVNSVFYGNAGTGTFTAGPVVASPSIFVNIDGIWKPINHIYVNINNIWQKST